MGALVRFGAQAVVIPFVHLPTGMPLDVVLAGSGLEDEFLRRGIVTDFNGTRVPVIEVGDLVIAKVLAGRPKDRDDARAHGPRLRQGFRAASRSLKPVA